MTDKTDAGLPVADDACTQRNGRLYAEALEAMVAKHSLRRDAFRWPDERGYFWDSGRRCILPWLRVCVVGTRRPAWQQDTWAPIARTRVEVGNDDGAVVDVDIGGDAAATPQAPDQGERDKRQPVSSKVAGRRRSEIREVWSRFMRADQLLHWMQEELTLSPKGVRVVLRAWLLPVTEEQVLHASILDTRVATVQMRIRRIRPTAATTPDASKPRPDGPTGPDSPPEEAAKTAATDPPSEGATRARRRAGKAKDNARSVSGRQLLPVGYGSGFVPRALREWIPGLDAVHTPDGEMAGLTNHLCEGWAILDDGRLCNVSDGAGVGFALKGNERWIRNKPKRMMLGASLSSRAVELVDPVAQTSRQLLVAFGVGGGRTHEDAIVVSRGAAEKLAQRERYVARVEVPRICVRVEKASASVGESQRAIRAWIDAYALGLSEDDLRNLPDVEKGWIEVDLAGAVVPFEGTLSVRELVDAPVPAAVRAVYEVVVERSRPLVVGDKLSTMHGIKGVVSAILGDADPLLGKAEILLSPLGTARRGAMGQFIEAAGGEWDGTTPPSGEVAVMRQPQHAEDKIARCGPKRAGGRERSAEVPRRRDDRGQRYGQQEFGALMAHGASKIAEELLSARRTRAPWMDEELRLLKSAAPKASDAARAAVNRFLSVAGLALKGRRLSTPETTPESRPGSRPIDLALAKGKTPIDSLDHFREVFGEGKVVTLQNRQGEDLVILLPPWLRPAVPGSVHPLTQAYHDLLRALKDDASEKIDGLVKRCDRLTLGVDGLGHFLKREVLGRRLTRSARAVIVPDPTLRLDQVGLPHDIYDVLLGGDEPGGPSPAEGPVLVSRSPVLHRYGLLALTPVRRREKDFVIGLPLGILGALGADFDGDQVCVVGLETASARNEAKSLMPGSDELRWDPFRENRPAFRFQNELSNMEEEQKLLTEPLPPNGSYLDRHAEYQRVALQVLETLGGWTDAVGAKIQEHSPLLHGMTEERWISDAVKDMQTVRDAVARKGQLGGAFRRHLYLLKYESGGFQNAVAALHAVTERLSQSSLSVKSGGGGKGLSGNLNDLPGVIAQINEGAADAAEALLPGKIEQAIGERYRPRVRPSILRWMAMTKPTAKSLRAIADGAGGADDATSEGDPRVDWFFGTSD